MYKRQAVIGACEDRFERTFEEIGYEKMDGDVWAVSYTHLDVYKRQDDSLARYATDPLINIITMLLIILGGIGFTVWYDVIDNGKKIWLSLIHIFRLWYPWNYGF